ncbi:MAG: non-homologous end-joining DNA ligase [Candidatus Eremiobacteraeota bacterium]|nr:non-homologous end-joining DNA ligase [Candidatus Eremiobacteraeota bacterium]MCW5867989.1 non-homologous end-joining DNA ligase [Candidatus Eremiobacteraeota bacterium]
MPLEDYQAKRNLDKTPEPTGAEDTPASELPRFCIQRHDARRLHYDLRLEHEGVLKSWAVPRGPSLDPEVKRLAVHTEDHPLEYLHFQGTIPAGNYGAGRMDLWDSGTYQCSNFDKQFLKGDLKLTFHGTRVRGDFVLVRTHQDKHWLWIKKPDEFADPAWDPEQLSLELWWEKHPLPESAVAAPFPRWLEPMLAQPGEAFSSPDFAFEMKWDGFRALAFRQEGELRLLSRKGNSLLRSMPELAILNSAFPAREYVLDGEIVCLDAEGIPQFQKLQTRSQATRPDLSNPVLFYAFDLLYLDGYDLRGVPWSLRRQFLEEGLRTSSWVRLSQTIEGDGLAFYELVRERGLEGIVAKRKAAPYTGKRSSDWIKVKTRQEIEAVIGGVTPPEGGRMYFGALMLGVREGDRLRHIGNVGSGFTQEELERLQGLLKPSHTCPFSEPPPGAKYWVEPTFQCQVLYQEVTRQGILRAPIYHGLVEDEVARPTLTNLDKIWFPGDGISKGQILDYYEQVADYILPHLRDRPLSLKRYPDGIEAGFFFQKKAYAHFPSWMLTYPLENLRGERKETPLCNDRASLLFLVNLGCIDHNPWLSRIQNLDSPDLMMLDLDPSDCDFAQLIRGALAVKQVLDELGLRGYPKTSGSRGLHIYVPVIPGYEFELTRTLATVIGTIARQRHPDLFTLRRDPGKRAKNRVYLDAPQNRRGATTAAAYSVRPVAGALVSTPLLWEEVTPSLDFRTFTALTAPARFAQRGDLLAAMQPQRLEGAVARAGELLA